MLTKISFNTGRSYTAEGQRIAAQAVTGGVLMFDYDRGIRYFLPDCALDQMAIMRRYDANDRTLHVPNEFYDTSRELESYALTAPSLPFPGSLS